MTDNTKTYLIWSHQRGAWWRGGGAGFTNHLWQAGRYSRRDALRICIEAMPGDAAALGALPDLPVAMEDVHLMRKIYCRDNPHTEPEGWE